MEDTEQRWEISGRRTERGGGLQQRNNAGSRVDHGQRRISNNDDGTGKRQGAQQGKRAPPAAPRGESCGAAAAKKDRAGQACAVLFCFDPSFAEFTPPPLPWRCLFRYGAAC